VHGSAATTYRAGAWEQKIFFSNSSALFGKSRSEERASHLGSRDPKIQMVRGGKRPATLLVASESEWTKAHREQYEKFLVETLSFPNLIPAMPLTREASHRPLFLQNFLYNLMDRPRWPIAVNIRCHLRLSLFGKAIKQIGADQAPRFWPSTNYSRHTSVLGLCQHTGVKYAGERTQLRHCHGGEKDEYTQEGNCYRNNLWFAN
jgi:hypothetical protein